jgi:hypothetical protein
MVDWSRLSENPWDKIAQKTPVTATPATDVTKLPDVDTGNFAYPSQWQSASDYLTGMLNANYTVPSAWTTGQGLAEQMAKTGNAADYSQWWTANQPVMNTQWSDYAKQLAEQMGVGGRYSTALQRNIADIGGRLYNQAFSNYMGMALPGIQSAKQAGISQLYNYGGGEAGLLENALNRGMSAAGGLGTLGGQYAQLPLSVAGYMGQLGQGMTNQQVSPYLSLIASMLGNMGVSSYPNLIQSLGSILGNADWSSILGKK